MEWNEALAKGPVGEGLLAGYARLLRLLAGLNSGHGFGFLTGHIAASVNLERVGDLMKDSLEELLRRRMNEVGETDRDIHRYLVAARTAHQ